MKIDKELLLEKQKQYTKEFNETIHKLNNPFCNTPHLGGEIISIEAKLSLIEELFDLLKENPETEKTNEEDLISKSTENPTVKTDEIEKELTNIKNLFQDMENIVKKDITEEILTLEKELLDLQFEYDKAILEKISELEEQAIKDRGGAGIGDYNPGYFEIHARMLCLPLLRKIYDKQYEIKVLEHKAIQNIQQTMR